MELINFDKQFEEYLAGWIRRNSAKYKNDMDAMEQKMPDIYLEFLRKPAKWLGGVAPGRYFGRFKSADELVSMMVEYVRAHVPVPDLLLERIGELGARAEEPLLALFGAEDVPQEAEMTAISLLRELQSVKPMERYIAYIRGLTGPDDKGDLCADALLSMGEAAVAPMLEALEGCGEAGLDIFADLLSNYPGDERIYALLMDRFRGAPDKRALFASYLAKLGDDRALPELTRAAQAQDVNYLDYVEIVNAIEALGGERPPEREFAGDPYYESLKHV